MFNFLKNWWQKRSIKHYVKNHWHLFADIIFLVIILGLIINLIVINKSAKQKVDITPVEHVSKIVEGETSDSLVINTDIIKTNIYSGKSFKLHLNVENKGSKDITDINITPAFINKGFIVSKIENDTVLSNIKVKSNKLVLEKLSAGETVEADISLIINAKTDSPRYVDWFFKTTHIEDVKVYTKNYDLKSLKLITELQVSANAYYHSSLGDQLGSGPVPPMVGLPTNYWVFFEVDNQGNDLSNLIISAKLSEAVTLSSGKTLSAGEFSYDENQKRVTWIIKKASVDINHYQVGFEVQLLSTNKQLGLKPLLVTSISYITTDAYTNEKLSGKLSNIDTELPLDIINQGQGIVVK